MLKQINAKIEFLKKLRPDIYLLGFNSSYIAQAAKPGQFIHIKIDEKITILRRPFSIHKINKNMIYLLFRIRGRGTKLLSQRKPGDNLDIIGPLGNGFNYVQPPLRGDSATLRTPTSPSGRLRYAAYSNVFWWREAWG